MTKNRWDILCDKKCWDFSCYKRALWILRFLRIRIRDIVFGRLVQAKQLLADTLSPLLVPGKPGGKGIQGFKGTHQSPPGLPRSNNVPHHSIQDAQLSSHNDEVPIDDQVCPKLFKYETRKVWGPSYDTLGAENDQKEAFLCVLDSVCQPYRTTPLVLPHAKTIHDTVPPAKFLNQHQHAEGQVVKLKFLLEYWWNLWASFYENSENSISKWCWCLKAQLTLS